MAGFELSFASPLVASTHIHCNTTERPHENASQCIFHQRATAYYSHLPGQHAATSNLTRPKAPSFIQVHELWSISRGNVTFYADSNNLNTSQHLLGKKSDRPGMQGRRPPSWCARVSRNRGVWGRRGKCLRVGFCLARILACRGVFSLT